MAWETSTRRSRLPHNWQQLRQQILQRDSHACQAETHNPRCNGEATEIDHITPGDNHAPENLQALNTWCHRDKTNAEAAARSRARSRRRPPEPHPGLIH